MAKFRTLHGNRNKKIFIGLVVFVILATVIIVPGSRAKYQVTGSIDIVDGEVSWSPTDITVVAYFDGIELDEFPTSSSGYAVSEVVCDNGASATFDISSYSIEVVDLTTRGTTCNVYFEEKQCSSADDIIASKTISTRDDFSTVLTTDTTGIVYSYDDGMYGGTSYYWAGATTDNYVYFAGYYWRIVRVNGDGSIRLIYDGTSAHSNGESSTDRRVGTSAYNSSYSYAEYVGFTYTTGSQRPSSQNGGTSSTIKGVLDDWYSSNLSNYASYLDTSGKFCNDRTSYSDTSGTTTGWASAGTAYYYGAYIRLYTNKSPSLSCSSTNDIYTTSIGLITADEVALAGGLCETSNSSYYLYTGSAYWTMSPYNSTSSGFARVFYVYPSGDLYYYYVTHAYGVRPVVNLSSSVTLSGSGTSSDPYEVC